LCNNPPSESDGLAIAREIFPVGVCMRRLVARTVTFLVFLAFACWANAEPGEKRIALVIGNAAYQSGGLATTANDAGLIAQTLQAAGFDVVGARDLDQDSLRRALHDFLDKAKSSGPGTVAFVYLSGHGMQLEGENYFVPVDARIGRDSDIAAEAVRISDYIRPLGALDLKASIVVLDAARTNPFTIAGAPIAGGLALVEPAPGMLVAFNAAPGTVVPEAGGPYGPYAQALAEMMREGSLPLPKVFERVRLRVNDMTKGAQVPWSAVKGEASFVFFERSSEAPALVSEEGAAMRARPVRDLGTGDAYQAVLERDTLEGYEEFIAAYPDDPQAKRVHVMIAARREAMTWRQSCETNTPDAYWSYLTRYPDGPHVADARRRLANRAFAADPPASFTPIDYSVPPPPVEEVAYVRRPVIVFDDPYYAFPPPPPLAVYFLPPPPLDFVVLLAPPPPIGFFVLPVPVFVPVPLWCHHPAYLVAPPGNVFFNNIHNTVVVNHVTNTVTIRNQTGQVISSKPAGGQGVGPSLPRALARATPGQPHGAGPGGGIPAQQARPAPGQPLPGMNGHRTPQAPAQASPAVPTHAVAPVRTTLPRTPPTPAAASPSAPVRRASVSPGPHPSPGPARTYRPASVTPARSFSPPAARPAAPAAARPAAPPVARAAPAPARKPPGH
jgi:uncharacterized caspase-like protein